MRIAYKHYIKNMGLRHPIKKIMLCTKKLINFINDNI